MENSLLDEIDSEFFITYSKTKISKSNFFPLQFYSWDIAIVWSNQWKNCQVKIFVTFFGPNLLPKWGHFWCTYHNCRSLPKRGILDLNTHFSRFFAQHWAFSTLTPNFWNFALEGSIFELKPHFRDFRPKQGIFVLKRHFWFFVLNGGIFNLNIEFSAFSP